MATLIPASRPATMLAVRRLCCRSGPSTPFSPRCGRQISTTLRRADIAAELEKQLNPRELIEAKRKAFEEKYGDKLRQRAEQEGVADVEALKAKVMAPSIRHALKAKAAAENRSSIAPAQEEAVREASAAYSDSVDRSRPARNVDPEQANKSGIKPLGSIINLPLLHLTPHDADAISKIWTAYHTSHSSLSASFLSASLPTATYASMVVLAQENPFFVLPLPRDATGSTDGQVKTDEYEMFYLQWLFHPTAPAPGSTSTGPLPPTTSIIFTPLEEYKTQGEWASPYLVLTHYPDLSESHGIVLMRGEITAQSASGPPGSLANPGWLLSQQQAQLLALALQRFYCAGIAPRNETAEQSLEREKRKQALVGLRTKPQEWDWTRLVDMAYAGMV